MHSWTKCDIGGCDECCTNPDCDGICDECDTEKRVARMLQSEEGRSELAKAMVEPIWMYLGKAAAERIFGSVK